MRAIDTDVLVRLIVRDDPAQTASATNFIQGGVWASVLAIAEATWVLSRVYGLSSKELAAAIEMLLNNGSLVLQDSETIAEALDLFRKKPSLGFSDCLMLQLARKAGHLPLGTFDRDLGKIEGTQKL